MLFSTAGISRRSCTGASAPISMRASASASAAPPMSFFMRIMPLEGLMSRPPVSKHTPLPTSVTSGAPRLPQRMSMSRGSRALPLPTS